MQDMSTPLAPVHIVGGGLAGSECAFQLASRGVPVVLHEMRPVRETPAHKSGDFAELVCSNSLRSDDPEHAAGLLKREMELFGSLIIGTAREAAVPAGSALAVDRDRFAAAVSAKLEALPGLEIRREEVTDLAALTAEHDTVLATGPLTSPALAAQLGELLGSDYLYFYDAIAPIVDGESLDMSKLFWMSRYGKGDGRRLPQLGARQGAVRRLPPGDPRRRDAAAPRLREGALLRGLPADRGARAARRSDRCASGR